MILKMSKIEESASLNPEQDMIEYTIKYPVNDDPRELSKLQMKVMRFIRNQYWKLSKITGILQLPKDDQKYLAELKSLGAELKLISKKPVENIISSSFRDETLFLMRFFQSQKEQGIKLKIDKDQIPTFKKIAEKLKESS